MLAAYQQVQASEGAFLNVEAAIEEDASQSRRQKRFRAGVATMTLVVGFAMIGACLFYSSGHQPAAVSTTKELALQGSDVMRRLVGYNTNKPIIFVTSEMAPWSITGGLGAVCDGLPRALAKMGHRVMAIAPRYDQYFDAWDTEFLAEVPLGEGMTTVRFFHSYKRGVDRVFVDHPLFLERVWGHSKQKLYGPKWGKDYEDNQMRFAMFCKAAMVATEKLKLGGSSYGTDVTFVANDWHAALIPMYLRQAQKRGQWLGSKSVILLHNLMFQGRFPKEARAAERLHLDEDLVDSMTASQTMAFGGGGSGSMVVLNFVMGGIKNSDLVLTVSPRYAQEVSSDGAKGVELEGLLAAKGVQGILNGVEDIVRPDNAEIGLKLTYDKTTLERKTQIKTGMQASLGFTVDASIPMFIFLGRLDSQKGVDVMFQAVDKLLRGGLNAQFITMGSGNEEFEEIASSLEERFPNNFKAVLSFKGTEKYKSYAASDFAIMPSRYEPCGLVQMESMRFGTLPIVTPTGGLLDTVADGQTGIVMEHEIDPGGVQHGDVDMLARAIERAAGLQRSGQIRGMQVNAMQAADGFTWANAARQYLSAINAMRR